MMIGARAGNAADNATKRGGHDAEICDRDADVVEASCT